MRPELILSLGCLGLFSLADLRYRAAPGAALFFLAAVLIALPDNPLRVGMVVLAVLWGMMKKWPALLALPLLLHPSTWAVFLVGTGVRRGEIGRFDILVLGGVACLFDMPAPILALVGVELWCRWLGRNREGFAPGLPGVLGGAAGYLILKAFLQM